MSESKRTKLGDTLRLQFLYKKLRCEVHGPNATTGNYCLKFFLFPSEEEVQGKALVIDELYECIVDELEANGIRLRSMSCGFDAAEKYYTLRGNFAPEHLMAAYEFQLSFGQKSRER